MSQPKKPGFFRLFKELAWAFLGVRGEKEYSEISNLSPIRLIVIGIICTLLFIFTILVAVNIALNLAGGA